VALIPVVSSWTLTLIEKKDDTWSWGNFQVYLAQCHVNLRDWGYIFIAG
jgi:hypothetical protein